MSKDFAVKQQGPVLRITMNRPKDGNRFSPAMAGELVSIAGKMPKGARIILLNGAGKDFCLGRAMMGPPPEKPEALTMRRQGEVYFNTYGAFRRSPYPVVASVQGKSVGFGAVLAGAADVTIAADDATFVFPEMSHRVMPTIAMSALVDRVPPKALLYLFYSSETIDAKEAQRLGLVSKIVPRAGLEKATTAFCKQLASMPEAALLAAKEFWTASRGMSASSATDLARYIHATVNSASEMQKPGH